MLRMSGSVLLLPLYVFMLLTWTNLLRNPDEIRTEYLTNVCFERSVIDVTGHCPGWVFSNGKISFFSPRRSCRFCKERPFLRTASWNSSEQKCPGRGLLTELRLLRRTAVSLAWSEHSCTPSWNVFFNVLKVYTFSKTGYNEHYTNPSPPPSFHKPLSVPIYFIILMTI